MSRRGRHAAGGAPFGPRALMDAVEALDDWALVVVGGPLVVGVMALWDWEPVAAVAAVGVVLTLVLAGLARLFRKAEPESWGQAVAMVLALVAAGAALLVVAHLAGSAILQALSWPFRQLATGFA